MQEKWFKYVFLEFKTICRKKFKEIWKEKFHIL